MTTVIGIRHGEVHNPHGVIYAGLEGFGLSDLGRGQAQAVAGSLSGLEVSAVYASPLQRAVETAAEISSATGVPVTTDERLHEWRYWTRWAGMTWEDLATTDRDAYLAYLEDPGKLSGDETLAQLVGRVMSWLDDVRAAHPDGLVLAVTHLEPLRAALVGLLDIPTSDTSTIRIGVGEAVRLAPDPHTGAGTVPGLLGT
jgi:broad specificity phosphatase PhoE